MDGGVVKLVVASMHDYAIRRVDAVADAVGDAMADVKALEFKGADLDYVSRLKCLYLCCLQQSRILELDLQQPGRQRCRVQGQVRKRPDHMLHRADMIFMTMREGDSVYTNVVSFFEPAKIGNDIVNTVHIVRRKHDAAVDQEAFAVPLEQGHVLADLPQSSDRGYLEFRFSCHVGYSPN